MTTNLSSPLPNSLRWFAAIIGLVSLLGTTLIWAQGVLMPLWPELLKPFNARFFGATYFGILGYIYFLLRSNRHDPGRLVITLSVVFSGMVSLITLFHMQDFLWERRMGTTGWFIFYFIPTFWGAYILWKYRNEWAPGTLVPYPSWLKIALQSQAVISIANGLALAIAPAFATSFWPWAVNDFHARAYSGIFLALGIGAYLLQKGGGIIENKAMGWGQTVLGAVVIGGFFYTENLLHKANLSGAGIWIWLGYFAGLTVIGIALLVNPKLPGRE